MLNTQCEYLAYLEAVIKLVDETPLQTEELKRLKEDLSCIELLVPVIGAFSAGKSSLLNSLLGSDVLGVGLTPETELATELRYNSESYLLALRPDGSSERLDVGELASIKSRSGEFTHLQLNLDNPQLKGLIPFVLVDMPGFGSSLANHNKAIGYYLPRGVHFVVVTSIEDGNITQSMMRQLDDLQTYGRDFTFLLNKVNLRADKEIKDVADLISEQIQFAFSNTRPVTCVGLDGGTRLAESLVGLEPEHIIRQLFEDRLKDVTQSLLNQLNLALASLKKNQAENQYALSELADGIRKIESKRDDILADLRNQQLDRVVEWCVAEAGRELENVREELVNAGMSGNKNAPQQIISEVVRGTMTRTIKNQMESISQLVVTDFGKVLGNLGNAMEIFNIDKSWLGDVSDRINLGLKKTGETLGHWSGSLEDHNSRELERLKKETNWKEGDPKPTVKYQSLATVLAVTTDLVNPLLELAIIFLPSILAIFDESRQKEKLRLKVMNELIPALKRQLRVEMPGLLNEQLNRLVDQVGAEFEREIGENRRIIDELMSSRHQDGQEKEQQVAHLLSVREELQGLAKETLYKQKQS